MGILKRDFKEYDEIMGMDIPLNGNNVSDIILYDPSQTNCYKNMQTKISSDKLDKVRVNENFIINYQGKYLSTLEGFLLHYDKEKDVLILIIAIMDCWSDDAKWVEKKRSFFTRDGSAALGSCLIEINQHTVDICGQSVFEENHPSKTPMNLPLGSKKAAMEYFGKFIFYYDKSRPSANALYTMNTRYSIKDMLRREFECNISMYNNERVADKIFNINDANADKIQPEVRHRQKITTTDRVISFTDEEIEIPEAAMEMMKKEAAKWFEKEYNISNFRPSPHERCETSFIQRYGNRAVHRIFFADVTVAYPLSDSKLELIEVERLYYDENIANVDMFYCLRTSPVWVDPDLKGTILEYNQEMLNYAVEQTVYYGIEHKGDYMGGLREAQDCFYDIYPCNINLAAFITAIINTNPVLEKLVNIKDCPHSFRKNLYVCASDHKGDVNALCLGRIDRTQQELHKMLCMPKGMFEYLTEMAMIDYTEDFKAIFQTKEEQKYFMNMNEADWKYMVNSFMEVVSPIEALKVVALLVSIRGISNLKNYVKFVTKHAADDDGWLDNYKNYLITIKMLGDAAKYAQWKLTGEAFQKSYYQLQAAAELSNFGIKNTAYKDMCYIFEILSNNWKNFEFEDENYKILWPEKPEDLVIEGIVLNHCAKTFLAEVYKGMTTILFIRRIEDDTKPYFTLEVRNGKIRQCHGFNNISILEDREREKLARFLHNFCKKNQIEYANGEGLLPA